MQKNIRRNVRDVARGTLTAACLTLAGMALMTLLAGYTALSDAALRVLNQLLKLASVTAGAALAVGVGGERGLIKGALTGALYMLLGMAAMALAGIRADGSVLLGEAAIGASAGGALGVLLANLPPRRAARKTQKCARKAHEF